MTILALDPGPTHTAVVAYRDDDRVVTFHAKLPNEEVMKHHILSNDIRMLAVEVIQGYGMSVGQEVFSTCEWVGRYLERWKGDVRRIGRRDVKLHLCHNTRAADKDVREALIGRYGGKEQAIGKRATPGPLYGVVGDEWQALAVAITAAETPPSRG